MLAWIVLIISGAFEAVWATALGKSEGFTKLWPTVVFAVGCAISMAGLAFALREIPTGTGYAVWVAVGASLTVVYGMITGAEAVADEAEAELARARVREARRRLMGGADPRP